MKGQHRVIVESKWLKYDFTITRNITIIKGDSATGKTTLYEMIEAFESDALSSGVSVSCDVKITTLSGTRWKENLETVDNSIVFIDEGNTFLKTNEFSKAALNSSNYFVIITRDYLPNLPYSVDEIYGIRTSGKYAGLEKSYHEFYKIYEDTIATDLLNETTKVLVEDSNSGYDFFLEYFKEEKYEVLSMNGKSNIPTYIDSHRTENNFVIADGAAFGCEMEKIHMLGKNNLRIKLYLPESFEWIILNANVLDNADVNDILASPEEYIESEIYASWEQYFYWLLKDISKDTYLEYKKEKLNANYLKGTVYSKIVEVINKSLT